MHWTRETKEVRRVEVTTETVKVTLMLTCEEVKLLINTLEGCGGREFLSAGLEDFLDELHASIKPLVRMEER